MEIFSYDDIDEYWDDDLRFDRELDYTDCGLYIAAG
jgi:hypothetical protein